MHNKPDINFFEEWNKLNTDQTWLICSSGHVHKDGFNRFTERNKFTIKVWGSIWSLKSLAKQVTRLESASASSLWPDNRLNTPSLEGATLCVGQSRFPSAYPWVQRALCLLRLFIHVGKVLGRAGSRVYSHQSKNLPWVARYSCGLSPLPWTKYSTSLLSLSL